MGFVENIHVALTEKFWEHLNYNFLYKFVSIFGACALRFPAIRCQSCRVGGFLTALSLGFILLTKFPRSFFLFPHPVVSKHIRSVGRHVGIDFCAKELQRLECNLTK